MKSFLNFLEKNTVWVLVLFCLMAAALHMKTAAFPPFNSDEASFAYNAYSIAETGKDEYGVFLPTRFKAFGENKLPVTIYLIAPFVKVLGLNEFASRLPFVLIGIITPFFFYYLTRKIFNNNFIALIAAFLASVSPWIQIMSRHIHENIIILILAITSIWLITKIIDKLEYKYIVWLAVMNGISLFTYHIGKVLAVYFFTIVIFILFQQKKKVSHIVYVLLIFLVPVTLFLVTEFQNPSSRVSNLLFINNDGFTASIEELRKEHDARLIHNKVTQTVWYFTNKHLSYYSPEFLITKGDQNDRFGFKGISPISAVEYLLMFAGLYYLFKSKEKYKFLILSFLLIAPLTASLSWQEYSLTRSFLLIIPILMLVSYGFYNLLEDLKKFKYTTFVVIAILAGYGFFTFYTWDFYFNHYEKRRQAISAWQGGYKELVSYVDQNYDEFDKFYVTNKLGQPYIFFLYYLQYSPEKYQQQAHLSELGQYGFGEVEQFDKFNFAFQQPSGKETAVYIGYPEDFNGTGVSKKMVKQIFHDGHEIFWIYEERIK